MTDCSLPRIWIIGSSLIARLQAHLGEFGLDQNLMLDCQITWSGRGGRRWEHLMPLLRSKRADIRDDPDVMVIHLGGNSIGTYGNTRISLMRRMKADITEIDLLFPKTKLMFSDIFPLWNWRGQTATTGYGLERTRRRLNGAMFGFLSDMGKCSVQYEDYGKGRSELQRLRVIVPNSGESRPSERNDSMYGSFTDSFLSFT
ncbi:hypothetical protein SKAU_G00019910 [Synaphobranchus kaupii]|uniref:SGNH hydrolase-type esterase domain-containing protein n=1 Tax=Synaphobranchus kaupii TaxID=118154 RepID=A0A9Q1GCR9_SYNKA|nr:hypothetical protein SKAU_G00019910 [Synaphobranchus kaupii]